MGIDRLRLIKPFVGQASTHCVADCQSGPRLVVNAQPFPVVVAKVKLVEVVVKVRLADVLAGAIQAALQDAEEAFNPVRVDFAANVLAPLL